MTVKHIVHIAKIQIFSFFVGFTYKWDQAKWDQARWK